MEDRKVIPYICAAIGGYYWLSIVDELVTGMSCYQYGWQDILAAGIFVFATWCLNRIFERKED